MNHSKRNARPVLAVFGLLALASVPACATNFTATLSGVPTFVPGASPLGGIGGCNFGAAGTARTYSTQVLVTAVAGVYSFTATLGTGGATDPFLALYLGVFDPANPAANLVGCNDDTNGLLPAFSSNLSAATTYTVVTTTFGPGNITGTVNFTVSPDITLVTSGSGGPAPVPVLGTTSMVGLAALLALAGSVILRRQRQSGSSA